MTLKTKLIAVTTALTLGVVLCVSCMFLSELLGDRISQTAAANSALVSEVRLSAQQAIVAGIQAHPPADASDAAVHAAVTEALRASTPLLAQMNSIVRYSPTVQDVSITDPGGLTLVSTDPVAFDQPQPERTTFDHLMGQGILVQTRMVFGDPKVLDISQPLDLNGVPLIYVHLGIRSSFLSNSYSPWLHEAILVVLFSLLAAVIAAAFLTGIALRPLGTISQQIDSLTIWSGREERTLEPGRKNAVLNVSHKIDVLGRRIRTSEQEYSALQANLNQMLDTLRDCVILFSSDCRAILVSEATADLIDRTLDSIVGRTAAEIFDPVTDLGKAIAAAFALSGSVQDEKVTLESGRRITFSLERIAEAGSNDLGALLTLRDTETVEQFERELDLSRRLAAIGRLTSGVGHEVKNPINSMVLHLELLKGKLDSQPDKDAHRHLDILTREMSRLDRVVQTLADFSRPIDLQLRRAGPSRHPLASVLRARRHPDRRAPASPSEVHQPNDPVPVHIDAGKLTAAGHPQHHPQRLTVHATGDARYPRRSAPHHIPPRRGRFRRSSSIPGQRLRHPLRHPALHLQPLLHHQAEGQRHRPRHGLSHPADARRGRRSRLRTPRARLPHPRHHLHPPCPSQSTAPTLSNSNRQIALESITSQQAPPPPTRSPRAPGTARRLP